MEIDRIAFGSRIKKRREDLGIKTQDFLGSKCGWEGKTKHRISLYEKGRRIPNGADLCILANALEVTSEWLLFGKESAYANKKGTIPIIPMHHVLKFIENKSHSANFLEKFLNNLGGDSFASFYVLAEGDSMALDRENISSHSVHDGDLVLVRPDLKPRNRDFVLITDGFMCTIRQYIAVDLTYFRSFDPVVKPILESSQNKVIGVITLIISPLKSKIEELAQSAVID